MGEREGDGKPPKGRGIRRESAREMNPVKPPIPLQSAREMHPVQIPNAKKDQTAPKKNTPVWRGVARGAEIKPDPGASRVMSLEELNRLRTQGSDTDSDEEVTNQGENDFDDVTDDGDPVTEVPTEEEPAFDLVIPVSEDDLPTDDALKLPPQETLVIRAPLAEVERQQGRDGQIAAHLAAILTRLNWPKEQFSDPAVNQKFREQVGKHIAEELSRMDLFKEVLPSLRITEDITLDLPEQPPKRDTDIAFWVTVQEHKIPIYQGEMASAAIIALRLTTEERRNEQESELTVVPTYPETPDYTTVPSQPKKRSFLDRLLGRNKE